MSNKRLDRGGDHFIDACTIAELQARFARVEQLFTAIAAEVELRMTPEQHKRWIRGQRPTPRGGAL